MERLEILEMFLDYAGLDNKKSDFRSVKTNYCELSEI